MTYDLLFLYISVGTYFNRSSKNDMIGKNATIICVGGWKYTGDVVDVQTSLTGQMNFVKIQTRNGLVIVNSQYIVSMMYEKN